MLLAEFEAVGLGVEDILMAASSCDRSDICSVALTSAMCDSAPNRPVRVSPIGKMQFYASKGRGPRRCSIEASKVRMSERFAVAYVRLTSNGRGIKIVVNQNVDVSVV